jgi:cell division septation protein DedD
MATRDGELFKEKIEVSLDGRQIFCLFCGGAVIASLVFVLGVMIGRRVEARTHPETAGAAGPGSDPLAALDQLAAGEGGEGPGLAFAETLRNQSEGGPLGPVDVSLEKAADEKDAEAAAAAVVKAPPAKPAAPVAAAPTPEPKADAQPEVKPPPKPEPRVVIAPDRAKFTLQLSSFQTRAEADAFAASLQKSGFAPYIVSAEVEGKGTWFRVRVGQYASQEDAMAAKTDFEAKQKMIAYVTRLKK